MRDCTNKHKLEKAKKDGHGFKWEGLTTSFSQPQTSGTTCLPALDAQRPSMCQCSRLKNL